MCSVLTAANTCAAEVVINATVTGSVAIGDDTILAEGTRTEVHEVWVFDLAPDGLIQKERDYLDTGALRAQLGVGGTPGDTAAGLHE